ncbi:MAG: CotH kinase family protein, partial [Anaerolineaceae bacterium]|nr:CotH kinase family protein [Anaerolineaceae bacterium]
MVTGRNFDRVAWTVTAVMIALTILFMNGTSIGLESVSKGLGYEARIFDKTRVHTIDIVMNDWDSFIENAASETYTSANVVIDGEVFKSVGIRGKGNTSLSNVSQMGSQRYSLKLEFDHYDKTKTYYGLDKLALNNLIQDSTMMKDYLTYTMMYEFGVHTPLCSFVYLTVNGEDWGLYLAVEAVEDAFLRRNYGTDYGELYKPDSTGFGGGRGNGREFRMSEFWNENFASKESETDETESSSAATPAQSFGQGGFDPSQMGGGGMPQLPDGFDPSQMDGDSEGSGENSGKRSRRGPGGGFGMGSSDVKLQYTDDEPESYSNIWNNAKTDIDTNDQMRLIQSLKKLSSYEDIDSVVDIDQVIRYFVVHNYVCNGDSYTGAMIHNYYLYEKDGQLTMIPWDYNLAYGTFQGSDATGTINTPIDSPASGSMEDRPMLNWIFEDEEYTELYHQYFSEFLESVDITGILDAAYELIAPYVEKDPTAFYTYEDFEKGADTLRKFCELR